ncbi:septation protein IspZ [Vibrio anguillarum]|uniref:COG4648 family protein n=1 Tax=Vibrio anguillarum TaxID=55601 RepID=UPI0009806D8D|nr:septation protein IspZ [Vibrio anguillarum]AQP35825.1 DNA gyrase subunit B [Vibrio anguillarum]
MRRLLTILSAIVLLTYPLAVYFGINQFGLQAIGGFLAAIFALRILSGWQAKLQELKQLAWISGFVGITLVTLGMLFQQHGWLLFYPVVVNVCLLALFALSLTQPQTVIERLARLQEPELPQSGIEYTRTVTKVWCLYFIMNGTIALYTCFQSIEIWTLYNGLISYLLAGSLFVTEWLVRQRIRKG